MRRQGRRFTLVLLCAVATVLGVGGTASAETGRPTPDQQLKNWDNGQCLAANLRDLRVQQNPCTQISLQQWSRIPVSAVGGGPLNYFLLSNRAGNNCMAVSGQVVNNTKIVLKPCNADDGSQIWQQLLRYPDHGDGTAWHIVSLQGALCLDKPQGDNTPGVQIQVRQCASIPSDWNPFDDQHFEQWWTFF